MSFKKAFEYLTTRKVCTLEKGKKGLKMGIWNWLKKRREKRQGYKLYLTACKLRMKVQEAFSICCEDIEKGRLDELHQHLGNLLQYSSQVEWDVFRLLALALKKSNMEAFDMLLKECAENNKWWIEVFGQAISLGNTEAVNMLLRKGMDMSFTNPGGRNVLMIAAMQGREEIVKILLETGRQDINAQDRNGKTALMLATERRHSGVVKILRESEINEKKQDASAQTADRVIDEGCVDGGCACIARVSPALIDGKCNGNVAIAGSKEKSEIPQEVLDPERYKIAMAEFNNYLTSLLKRYKHVADRDKINAAINDKLGKVRDRIIQQFGRKCWEDILKAAPLLREKRTPTMLKVSQPPVSSFASVSNEKFL